MAFQFPATPFDLETVENPSTESVYQWRADLNKWVLVGAAGGIIGGIDIDNVISEGPIPPVQDPEEPIKLWYNTDTLELYFYYTDVNGNTAWVPTAIPIQTIDALNVTVAAQASTIQQQLDRIAALETAVFGTP